MLKLWAVLGLCTSLSCTSLLMNSATFDPFTVLASGNMSDSANEHPEIV